jgi:hypothetical protein
MLGFGALEVTDWLQNIKAQFQKAHVCPQN